MHARRQREGGLFDQDAEGQVVQEVFLLQGFFQGQEKEEQGLTDRLAYKNAQQLAAEKSTLTPTRKN